MEIRAQNFPAISLSDLSHKASTLLINYYSEIATGAVCEVAASVNYGTRPFLVHIEWRA